jgi:uncharacterized protein (TIGR03437 family)
MNQLLPRLIRFVCLVMLAIALFNGFALAQSCSLRQVGTANGASGIGVAYAWSDGKQATRYVVTRAGISFTYDGSKKVHSEISGCGFGAQFTVRGEYPDGSQCLLQSSGTAPHSAACTPSSQLFQSVALNAASYSDLLAPGAIVSIFGQGFATHSEAATSLPLPEQLANVEVWIFKNTSREKRLKLFYAGDVPGMGGLQQVNALLPDDMPSGGVGTLAVINVAADFLRPTWFYVNRSQPGVFTRSANGLGPAAGYWAGDTFAFYATGITSTSEVYLQVGNQRFPASYAGPAPGYVGLQQINIPGLLGVRGYSGVLCAGLCSQFFEVPR